mmetsp:Transcript_9640/g.27030  ORF Transcript_9640/g.27030 Transcript_9640/m.27030 type:complete len:568 (+) Transcript_9640:138-1841(+)|eukprot:CAMPEP_0119120016 /NCGR_PEP_ID=MMETSP1310-20130426/1251_1 /TAXON_ID=464262 /ORGANISM="Genus nov. species nov., Strain RCC2339" /LENGTH=567 /DNA_ID=CAMNT_0007109479 /DNA_START=131 /DNA_END=1834 /DNA_ORIENTATION=+
MAVSMESENVAVVRKHMDLVNEGKLEEAFDLISDDVVMWARGMELKGKAMFRRIVEMARYSFSEYKETIEDIFASGDRVCVRGVRHGKHTKSFGAVPATNKEVATTFMFICIVKDGKIVERWTNHDDLGFLQAMGLVQLPGHGGNHGHSHGEGGQCNHSHGQDGGHGHSHGGGGGGGGTSSGISLRPSKGKKFPYSAEELSQEWFTAALQRHGLGGAKISDLKSETQANPTSVSETCVSVTLTFNGQPSKPLPTDYVAHFPTSNQMARPIFKQAKTYMKIVRFHDQMAKGCKGLRTPTTFYGNMDPESDNFLLVTEDISRSLQKGSRMASLDVSRARTVVEKLALFHAQCWQTSAKIPPSMQWLSSPPASELIILKTYQGSWPFFYKNFPNLSADVQRTGQKLADTLPQLYSYNRQQAPITLCHNDLHAGTLFFDSQDNCVVESWHQVSFGHAMRDVVSFLSLSLSCEDRKAHEEELLRRYHQVLMENKVTGYKFQKCFYDYKLLLLLVFAEAVCNGAGLFVLESQGKLPAAQKPKLDEYQVIFSRLSKAISDHNCASLIEDFSRKS